MRYGVVPAGGLGTRSLLPHSKELALVGSKPVIEYIFDRLYLASITRIFVTTAADKTDLISYLTNDSPHKDRLKIIIGERKGLLDGIISPGQSLNADDTLYFGLPDTIWYPEDGFTQLDKLSEDLVLGAIPSDTPNFYGSLELVGDVISKVVEKPACPNGTWIWAFGKFKVKVISEFLEAAKLSPAFTEILGRYAKNHVTHAVKFEDGIYIDTGTPAGLKEANNYVKK
jgi:dTDP-glucose pyrophosphorylase